MSIPKSTWWVIVLVAPILSVIGAVIIFCIVVGVDISLDAAKAKTAREQEIKVFKAMTPQQHLMAFTADPLGHAAGGHYLQMPKDSPERKQADAIKKKATEERAAAEEAYENGAFRRGKRQEYAKTLERFLLNYERMDTQCYAEEGQLSRVLVVRGVLIGRVTANDLALAQGKTAGIFGFTYMRFENSLTHESWSHGCP
jgi:hypothetical protein